MTTRLRWITIVLLLLPVGVERVAAQEIAGTFDQLRVLVKQGDTITVADDAGSEMTGTIADLSSSSLALLVDGRRHDLQANGINTIRQRRSDSLANGAKWGFGIGAGLGLAAAVSVFSVVDDSGYAILVFVPLVYGGMGAAVGVGVDAMVSTNQVIYARRAASSARLRVTPLLTRHARGAAVTVGF